MMAALFRYELKKLLSRKLLWLLLAVCLGLLFGTSMPIGIYFLLFSLATVSAAVACAALVALSSALFRHPPLSLLIALCFRLAPRQFLKRRKA